MPKSTRTVPCAVCSDPVDPDVAHTPHREDCPNDAHTHVVDCDCDLFVHPECCPDPACQEPAT